MRAITSIFLMLLLALCLGAGCVLTHDPVPVPDAGQISDQMQRPGMSLMAIGVLAHDLAEKYEDAGERDLAITHYRRSIWAFRQQRVLTGDAPALLQDSENGLARLLGEGATSSLKQG